MKIYDFPNYVAGDTIRPLKFKLSEKLDGEHIPLNVTNIQALFQLRDKFDAIVTSQSLANGLLKIGEGCVFLSTFTAPSVGRYKFQLQIVIGGYVTTIVEGSLTTVEDIARYG